jgi:hypothetical protein
LETEITTSTYSSFSGKLIIYHIGLLFQTAQNYHGAGLESAMSTDIVTDYDGTILKNLIVTMKWFNTLEEVKRATGQKPPIFLESTGHYHSSVVQYLEERGYLIRLQLSMELLTTPS